MRHSLLSQFTGSTESILAMTDPIFAFAPKLLAIILFLFFTLSMALKLRDPGPRLPPRHKSLKAANDIQKEINYRWIRLLDQHFPGWDMMDGPCPVPAELQSASKALNKAEQYNPYQHFGSSMQLAGLSDYDLCHWPKAATRTFEEHRQQLQQAAQTSAQRPQASCLPPPGPGPELVP